MSQPLPEVAEIQKMDLKTAPLLIVSSKKMRIAEKIIP
jgi:hypothetical protein